MTPQPLAFIGGDEEIAYDVAAYAADRPRALPGMTAGRDRASARRAGAGVFCAGCDLQDRGGERCPAARVIESTIVRNFWRFPGKPQNYTIVVVPPRR